MFGKIVAISTVKHLSRNYTSFQQPSESLKQTELALCQKTKTDKNE